VARHSTPHTPFSRQADRACCGADRAQIQNSCTARNKDKVGCLGSSQGNITGMGAVSIKTRSALPSRAACKACGKRVEGMERQRAITLAAVFPSAELACGQVDTTARFPAFSEATARCRESVVFPVPPFWLNMDTMYISPPGALLPYCQQYGK